MAVAKLAAAPVAETPSAILTTISPQLAEEWLLCNAHNRPLSDTTVERYARDMSAGRWLINGDPIRFNVKGALVDGQHRLSAIVRSGRTVSSFVVRDLHEDAFHTIDQQRRRSTSDYLALRDVVARHVIEKAITTLWQHANGYTIGAGGPNNVAPTVQEALDLFERNPGLINSYEFLAGLKSGHLAPRGMFIALHYLMAKSNAAKADAFFTDLAKGAGLADKSPAYHLRERLIAVRAAKDKTHRLRGREIAALTIKAWNAYRLGASMNMLKWTSRGRTAEAFPTIQ